MFEAVRSADADCCVAPIENSLAGSIHRNYDLLIESGLNIFGETNIRIVHNVIAAPDGDAGERAKDLLASGGAGTMLTILPRQSSDRSYSHA